ncbi:hypothetical protein [Pleionea sp. CnH1-48]|uniref:hypothetical protein n=1 Tax=Pleionea sp. CnH1-48 TaxID=2954494 RepID=UPI002097892E|nr:hypothetical protein [Pleionea sp. CnH1-48]MCO7223909.1 hypothetical protein [Pleionea sp. CnH1-48]
MINLLPCNANNASGLMPLLHYLNAMLDNQNYNFIVYEEFGGDDFVQFGINDNGKLYIDIPQAILNKEELARAQIVFKNFRMTQQTETFYTEEKQDAQFLVTWQKVLDWNDLNTALDITEAMFNDVFESDVRLGQIKVGYQ